MNKRIITRDAIRKKMHIHERVLVEAYSISQSISFIGVLLFATDKYYYVGNPITGQSNPLYAPRVDKKAIPREIEIAFKLYPKVFISRIDLIAEKQPHKGFGTYLELSDSYAEDYNSFIRELELST